MVAAAAPSSAPACRGLPPRSRRGRSRAEAPGRRWGLGGRREGPRVGRRQARPGLAPAAPGAACPLCLGGLMAPLSRPERGRGAARPLGALCRAGAERGRGGSGRPGRGERESPARPAQPRRGDSSPEGTKPAVPNARDVCPRRLGPGTCGCTAAGKKLRILPGHLCLGTVNQCVLKCACLKRCNCVEFSVPNLRGAS